MRFLLDTHSLIWFFSGNLKLSDTVRSIMENTDHKKLISLATIWEIAIKQSKNKLTLNLPLEEYIKQKIQLEDFAILPIKLSHLVIISKLPFYHNDPFDRLIIAQAMIENIPILSRDIAFDFYNINRIWNEDA